MNLLGIAEEVAVSKGACVWRANFETIQKIINTKVKSLIKRGKLKRSQAVDFEQELSLRVIAWLSRNARSESQWNEVRPYLRRVVCQLAINILKRLQAKHRASKHVWRLCPDEASQSDQIASIEIRIDIDTILSRLPKEVRSLAEQLMQDKYLSEILRTSDLTHAEARAWLSELRTRLRRLVE